MFLKVVFFQPQCTEVIGSSEPVFRRLEHIKLHEFSRFNNAANSGLNSSGGSALAAYQPSMASMMSSFSMSSRPRKRGRPPKYLAQESPQTPLAEPTLADFKLPRGSCQTRRGRPRTVSSPPVDRPQGFNLTIGATSFCGDPNCPLRTESGHLHCNQPRCFYAANSQDACDSHVNDFHQSLEIPETFSCYDRAYPCFKPNCPYTGTSRHFHCLKSDCRQAFVKFNLLSQHEVLHRSGTFEKLMKLEANSVSDSAAGNTVKTAGIFFPTDTVTSSETTTPTMSTPILAQKSEIFHSA